MRQVYNRLPALLFYIDELDLETKAASAPALPISGEDPENE